LKALQFGTHSFQTLRSHSHLKGELVLGVLLANDAGLPLMSVSFLDAPSTVSGRAGYRFVLPNGPLLSEATLVYSSQNEIRYGFRFTMKFDVEIVCTVHEPQPSFSEVLDCPHLRREPGVMAQKDGFRRVPVQNLLGLWVSDDDIALRYQHWGTRFHLVVFLLRAGVKMMRVPRNVKVSRLRAPRILRAGRRPMRCPARVESNTQAQQGRQNEYFDCLVHFLR